LAVPPAGERSASWPYTGYDLADTHIEEESPLDPADARNLSLEWVRADLGAVSATPAVAGGVVFTADWEGHVYALDAENGDTVWREDFAEPFSASPTLGQGLVFLAGGAGDLFALNATTGSLAWRDNLSEFPQTFLFAPPLFENGSLFVGTSSTEEWPQFNETPTFRGAILRLNATTGHAVWKTYTVPPGETGGGDWTGEALDAASGTLFVATSNAYTAPAAATTDAILALSASNGSILWSTQTTENDTWTANAPAGPDDDLGVPVLLWHDANGTLLVGGGAKDGTFWALHAEDGTLAFASYLPSNGTGFFGGAGFANGTLFGTLQDAGRFVALNATSGALRYERSPSAGLWGVTGAGDVLFTASASGDVDALSRDSGAILWSGRLPGALSAGWQAYAAPAIAGAEIVQPFATGTLSGGPGGLAAYGVPG
jgi:polyvinyl alcohol dehydrogenase (cytochrome)